MADPRYKRPWRWPIGDPIKSVMISIPPPSVVKEPEELIEEMRQRLTEIEQRVAALEAASHV